MKATGSSDKAAPSLLLGRTENGLLVLTIALILLLPLLESFFRRVFHVGIPGSISFVQHLVVYVAMLGSAVAARESKLLTLSTVTDRLSGTWRIGARIFAGAMTITVTFALMVASASFVLSKREAGEMFVGHVALWPLLVVLPVGFALLGAHELWTSGGTWRGRTVTALAGAVFLAIGMQTAVPHETLLIPALIALIIAMALGAPIFTALGGAGLILFWASGQPTAMIAVNQYQMTVEPALPAIPLFTLVGYILAEGGASRRLVNLFEVLFSRFRGGPAIAASVVCALFTAFTGASGVTILALGGLLMPVLLAANFQERRALGLLTSAGSLGLLFPPSLPVILYAVIATQVGTEITIGSMFLAGALPGLLLVCLTAWWGVRSDRRPKGGQGIPFSAVWPVLWDAKWELLVPIVALASLFSGVTTTVEAAAVTALYALIVEVFVYRDLSLTRDLPRIMVDSALLVGGVLLILGVAMGFTDYLFTANMPERLVVWAHGFFHAKWTLILGLNLLLLVVGCLMEMYAAIVVIPPLIIPVAHEFGIDPLHLGVIFLANLELGFLTPLVGINLFLSSYRFNKPMPEVIRSILPIFAILLAGVLIISYVPVLSTFLPRLLGQN